MIGFKSKEGLHNLEGFADFGMHSNHLSTGNPNTGFIWILDFLEFSIQMVYTIILTSVDPNHSKTGPFVNRTHLDHSKTRLPRVKYCLNLCYIIDKISLSTERIIIKEFWTAGFTCWGFQTFAFYSINHIIMWAWDMNNRSLKYLTEVWVWFQNYFLNQIPI